MKTTGTIMGGPRLAKMLREQAEPKESALKAFAESAVGDFVIGLGLLAAGIVGIIFVGAIAGGL